MTTIYNKTEIKNALLIWKDESLDLSLVKLNIKTDAYLKLASAETLKGFKNIEVGLLGISGDKRLFSFGTLEGDIQRRRNSFLIPNAPGDSGGPIFTKDGYLVGVLTHGVSSDKIASRNALGPAIFVEMFKDVFQ